jgi:hypothetical protein
MLDSFVAHPRIQENPNSNTFIAMAGEKACVHVAA